MTLKKIVGFTYFKTAGILSEIGRRTGSEWLLYNPLIHFYFERAAKQNAPPFVDALTKAFPEAKTIADVGCGTGRFGLTFQQRGYRVVACEYDARLRRKCARRGLEVYPLDASKKTRPLPGAPLDLAFCIEVAEHVPESLADPLVRYIAGSGKRIVFTAAHPGQGGTGHINEQPQEYWIEKFERNGVIYDRQLSQEIASELSETSADAFLSQNMMVFLRPDQPGR